ncbi:hypothetical protein SODALDRAFT_355207 [Sodiomyces alkalinus F11]|uniref:Uncharacterized protein n=1 Tax=Sodiomyces alkalinus (strain CBS 110278 / VKM F-3762 / F11) TaxID=1314773 RepID=A0A3N2Q8F3_SODAK|nr:hypothetical protein SODALDRAFT_355207 [Sodiomyces alkalinus F11]ROT43016.1 hypothetical protein SODALDRAFT_355207 [Sodiomyces alkalinus F11]
MAKVGPKWDYHLRKASRIARISLAIILRDSRMRSRGGWDPYPALSGFFSGSWSASSTPYLDESIARYGLWVRASGLSPPGLTQDPDQDRRTLASGVAKPSAFLTHSHPFSHYQSGVKNLSDQPSVGHSVRPSAQSSALFLKLQMLGSLRQDSGIWVTDYFSIQRPSTIIETTVDIILLSSSKTFFPS